MAKSVKVHDDTHRFLKELKAKHRNGSIDQVIKELIMKSTGTRVEERRYESEGNGLNPYLRE